ncbi:MFS transporter [Kribbella albertanoniae]|uniref:MFS transporter n=1 Tax=Kribbella albertanoniae TaxID=1266829 RepID=A0A4R4Q6B4_9ACTN|nr:MFS transporter [Kribbella albertanoniae]TDC30674.1 MFS transporter [Kribbella albertanoniae]
MRVHWDSSLRLLRHAPFRNQYLASSTSMIGSAITPVALTFGVLEATGSVADLGYVLTAYSVSQVVFMLIGGVWADRVPRQRLMMLADGLRVITQVGFGVLLLTGEATVPLMILLQLVCGAATAFFLPASVGLVALTAPPGLVQEANGLISLTRNLIGTVGPMVAGTLVITSGAGWALVIDGLTFVVSMIFLARLVLPERVRTAAAQVGFWKELRAGWHEVTRRSWIWTSILYFMVFNLMFSAFQVLGPAALVDQHDGGLRWGAIIAGLSVGQVMGNALTVWLRPAKLLLIGRFVLLLACPVLLLLAADSSLILLVVASALAGIAISFPDTLWDTALQEQVPEESLSRVSSFDFTGSLVLRPVGLALAAAIAAAAGTEVTLIVSAAVIVVATFVSLLDPATRRLTRLPVPDRDTDDLLPDGAPDAA